jgi:hypothetical protein
MRVSREPFGPGTAQMTHPFARLLRRSKGGRRALFSPAEYVQFEERLCMDMPFPK